MQVNQESNKLVEANKDKIPDKKNKKEEQDLENLGKEFTGEGFMSYDDLVSIVKAYQQRQFCEDVDIIKKIGGKSKKTHNPLLI